MHRLEPLEMSPSVKEMHIVEEVITSALSCTTDLHSLFWFWSILLVLRVNGMMETYWQISPLVLVVMLMPLCFSCHTNVLLSRLCRAFSNNTLLTSSFWAPAIKH